jgi:alkaline phosphatase
MHEAMSLDLAVETALKMTNREDTLIIVTADHGHTMEMTGYQTRGSDVRGKSVSRNNSNNYTKGLVIGTVRLTRPSLSDSLSVKKISVHSSLSVHILC